LTSITKALKYPGEKQINYVSANVTTR